MNLYIQREKSILISATIEIKTYATMETLMFDKQKNMRLEQN